MFIENVGQFDSKARFQVRGANGTLYLSPNEMWMTLIENPVPINNAKRLAPSDEEELKKPRKAVNLQFTFADANPTPRLEGFDPLDTKVSFLYGKDQTKWKRNTPTYSGVRYVDLYPGIDLEITSEKGRWVWRLIPTNAQADLAKVRLRVNGHDAMRVENERLRLNTILGEVSLPMIQSSEGAAKHPAISNNEIASPFTSSTQSNLLAANASSPDLLYSTYLGSEIYCTEYCGIAVDASGAMYVTGSTMSASFPTTPGAFEVVPHSLAEVFVTKLNPDGSSLAYSTFFGGVSRDYGVGIAVEADGSAYIAGSTFSSDFPITADAFDAIHNGSEDGFVAKLSPDGGSLIYSSYIGGASVGIALDTNGAPYITGKAGRVGLATVGAFSTSCNTTSAFVMKLNSIDNTLGYYTYICSAFDARGGGIAVDGNGSAYITGEVVVGASADFPTTAGAFDTTFNGGTDVYVTKLSPDASSLVYSTFLGGSSNSEVGFGIAVDASGAAYVTGYTLSSDFPTTAGALDVTRSGQDGFVTKLSADGSRLIYSTFIGGGSDDYGKSIAVDGSGATYLTGYSGGYGFPITPDALTPEFSGGAFATKLNADGTGVIYSTFFGGGIGTHIFVDGNSIAYITGWGGGPGLLTTSNAFDPIYDDDNNGNALFVTKLRMVGGGVVPPTATPVATATPTITPLPTFTSTPTLTPTQADTYVIAGRVTNALSTPLSNVAVVAASNDINIPNVSAVTDNDGRYELAISRPSTYAVVPTLNGFTFSGHPFIAVPPGAQNVNFTGYDTPPIVFVTGYSGIGNPLTDCIPFSRDRYFQKMDNDLNNAGYYIEFADIESSPCYTPSITKNATRILEAVNRAKNATGQPKVIIVAHSMGGLVSRAYIEGDYKNGFGIRRDDVLELFTFGSPHHGVTSDTMFLLDFLVGGGTFFKDGTVCQWQVALCEMTPWVMPIFNQVFVRRPGVTYHMINGNASPQSLNVVGKIVNSFIQGANDATVTVQSGTGADLSGLIDRWQSDESHADKLGPNFYFIRGGDIPSLSYSYCIEPILVTRTSTKCIPTVAASLLPHLARIVSFPQDVSLPQTTPSVYIPLKGGNLKSGESITRTVSLEGGQSSFVARWESGTFDFVLIDPNGQVIDAAFANNNPSIVSYTSTSVLAIYQLFNARSGEWKMVLRANSDVPANGSNYVTTAIFASTVSLTGATDKNWYASGTTANVIASLTGSINSSTITATVTRPNGVSEVITLSRIRDQQYRGSYIIPAVPGYARVELNAAGTTTAGQLFERGTILFFQISPQTASLSGVYSEVPQPRPENPTLYQALIINTGVNSSISGSATLSADLVDADGKFVAHGLVTQNIVAGTNTLALTFAGSEIYASQSNGPYILTNVLLLDSLDKMLVLAEAKNVYRTVRYRWRDFAPVSPPTTNPAPLNSFVVLGQEGVWLKEKAVVHNGNVGANTASVGPHLDDRAEVIIGAQVRFLNPSSLVLGDSLVIREKAQVYDVYYNEIRGNGTVQGRRYTPLALPLVNQLPAIPIFISGSQRVDVREEGTLTLAAGDYGDLRVRSKATITFTGGIYTFKSWDVGEDVKLYFTAPSEIRIVENLDTNAKTYLGPKPGMSGLTAKDIRIIVLGQNGRNGNPSASLRAGPNAEPRAAKFGERNKVIANVYAPNGTLWLREKTEATGSFIAKWVVVGEEVELKLLSR